MSKIEEAKQILQTLGLPRAQQSEIAAYTLLALCNIKPADSWDQATRQSLKVTKGIMAFCADVYHKQYAPNSRETFRRQVLHQFVQARLVDYNPDNPNLPVNSPNAHYAIACEALNVIKTYGTPQWENRASEFAHNVKELARKYTRERNKTLIPVKLKGGKVLKLSAGKHNAVQAAVIEQFAPRFAPGCEVVYLGDTANKDLFFNKKLLRKLGIPIDEHSKLPDIVLYDEGRKWLFLIEAVTSHGPVSYKRIVELEDLLKNCEAGKIYVSAFPDFIQFKRHTANIAWDTEVWIVEFPEHMIHFNGDRFMGPR